MGEGRQDADDLSETKRRLIVQQAADHLGISVDGVRGRIRRGTIEYVREGGRVYVLLDADTSHTNRDEKIGQYSESNTLISQLRSEIYYLREENRRKDEIIMQQALTVRQITAASESPESAGETAGSSEAPQDPEEPASRPWWRRWFGSS
jgi:hypothetical protein